MKNIIYDIYINKINEIKNTKNTEAIFLVGSSKNVDFSDEKFDINDIDIFVLVKDGDIQIRDIKKIDNIEFDINYFPQNVLKKMIDSKEYFFLREMSNPKILYDKKNNAENIIKICKSKFIEGPDKISLEEKNLIKNNLFSKIESLKNKDNIEKFEYEFLTNIYIKDMIVGYFNINNKWIPKEKNMIKELKLQNLKLFELIKKVYEGYEYKDLLNVYKHL